MEEEGHSEEGEDSPDAALCPVQASTQVENSHRWTSGQGITACLGTDRSFRRPSDRPVWGPMDRAAVFWRVLKGLNIEDAVFR